MPIDTHIVLCGPELPEKKLHPNWGPKGPLKISCASGVQGALGAQACPKSEGLPWIPGLADPLGPLGTPRNPKLETWIPGDNRANNYETTVYRFCDFRCYCYHYVFIA